MGNAPSKGDFALCEIRLGAWAKASAEERERRPGLTESEGGERMRECSPYAPFKIV